MSNASRISPRFVWTAGILPLEPDHHVLEVGCGHGIALGLVAARLTTGTVTGVDRSAKMTAAAAKRNAGFVAAGKVRLRTALLHELEDDPGSFDLIFAINVASFWTQPARDLVAARRLLTLGGALCLSIQLPPWGKRETTLVDNVSALLAAYDFVVISRPQQEMEPYPVAALIARSSDR